MNEALVVDELVPLTGLNLAIQHKAPAKAAGIDDLYRLIAAPARVNNSINSVDGRKGRPQIVMEPLGASASVVFAHGDAPATTFWATMPLRISIRERFPASSRSAIRLAASSGTTVSPHVNTSTAAYLYSGQV